MKLHDIVSWLFLLVTIGLFTWHMAADKDVSSFLCLVALFIIRGIIWQEGYIKRIRYLEEENEFLRKQL